MSTSEVATDVTWEHCPALNLYRDVVSRVSYDEQGIDHVSLRNTIGFTYLVFCPVSQLLKIGQTRAYEKRMKSLQMACPVRLVLLALLKGSGYESVLHQRWDRYRAHGEWFRVAGHFRLWLENHFGQIPAGTAVLGPESDMEYPQGYDRLVAALRMDSAKPGPKSHPSRLRPVAPPYSVRKGGRDELG
jgi:hypothetical protein